MTKEESKEEIKILIDKFSSQFDFYKSLNYNETQTRQDFINPFFKALGWDIDNGKQQLETYRDVRHEDKIKINGHTKAPDYSFNINGKRKFFVEAKKPSISIKENPMPALQVRNYAWNGGLSVSILTDFEELAIYDCTRKPKNVESANAKRLKYIYYTDYIKEFDFIYDTFSYDSVLNGSIEIYAKNKINFKNAEPVDKEFLKTLERWREYLATTIALRNKQLEETEINYSVQQTIDRIVFLKVCEDRKIEPENNLFKLTKSGNLYQNLFQYFQTADQKYNSGLFDFKKDTITQNLEIDNKVIKNIITELYGKSKENETEFGFNFAIIPVEILGLAYEQFLGKVIRLTKAHHAKIEEKPEVRKAGGVYYTPEYIVEYIVKQTVGELIENKTPDEISKIKILDPSCGSGSFLLGAYQYLLDYHLKYYNQLRIRNYELGIDNGKQNSIHNSEFIIHNLPLTPDGYLTSQEKKRILLNNIFGVDIDTQAVEVTKLSLLLKALEGETEASIQTSLQLFNERVLPTIDNNIQCGNSLVGSDFYDKKLFLSPKEERKINVFDWNVSFKDIFKATGFDCIIGNPPWGSKDVLTEKSVLDYIVSTFNRDIHNMNIFALFIDQSRKLLKIGGILGFLIPKNFIKTQSYIPYRLDLLNKQTLNRVTDFGKFPQVAQEAIALFSTNNPSNSYYIKRELYQDNKITELDNLNVSDILQDEFKVITLSTLSNFQSIVQKIENNSFKLGSEFEVLRGMEHGRNGNLLRCTSCNKYFEKPGKRNLSLETIKCKHCNNDVKIVTSNEHIFIKPQKENASFKGLLIGNSIDRYELKKISYFVEPDLAGIDYKKIHKLDEKLLFIRISKTLRGYLDTDNLLCLNALNIVYSKNNKYNLKFVLGILNSNLYAKYIDYKITSGANLTIRLSNETMKSIPIYNIDFDNKNENKLYNEIIELVESILELNKRKSNSKLPTEIEQLSRRIIQTDKKIDKKVCELYKLSPQEIEQIEKQ